MLAAYTFGSALELSDFCARHRITREDTYSVLQSLVAPIWEGECYAEMRLTLVLNMAPEDLEHIRERERAEEQAQREREEAVRKETEARDAETRRRWMEENAVDIPF